MEVLFPQILRMSITATWAALAVMAIRLLFRKAPKWMYCLLWGLVALRLLCPVAPESPLSLAPPPESVEQIITQGPGVLWEDPIPGIGTDAVLTPQEPVSGTTEPPETPAEQSAFSLLSGIWMAGVLGMFAYALGSYLLLKRRMAEATLLRENIWQCERAESPFVLGFLRPRIYLPYGICPEDQIHVIAHEQAHIRRKDQWWKPLGFLLLAAHWFNPVLWLSYILLCRDIEGACDEKVIQSMERADRQAYSTALLHCSIRRRTVAACPLAFGETGVKERVKNVMKYKKPGFILLAVALVVCIVVGVCFLTNPVADDTPDENETLPNETETTTEPRMINLNGIIYIDSGEIVSVDLENAISTGTLHTQVEGRPQNHNQGNFDCVGCEWVLLIPEAASIQYGVLIDGAWHLFIEEVLEFPEYWLTIGGDNVYQISVHSGARDTIMYREDWTPYPKGTQVRLDLLSGKERLLGVSITAKDAKGRELWGIAISGREYGEAKDEIVSGDWIITPVRSDAERDALKARYEQSNTQISDSDWGVELLVKNITPGSLDLFLFRYGQADSEPLMTSENFLLYQLRDGLWHQLAVVPADWSDAASLKELRVENNDEIGDSVRLELNWTDLCGELESGTYRISTDIARMDDYGRMIADQRYTTEFVILSNEEETRIYETVQTLLTAHIHNAYLYTEEPYDHLTVLALGSDHPAFQEYGDNIRFLQDKERYYKHVRQAENITREDFSLSFALHAITVEQGTAKVTLSAGISFRYTDQEVESGGVHDFHVELVNHDGTWYVSSVMDIYDWFDGTYRDDPNFDVDELIAQYDQNQ